jgi:hypothetical protein
MIQPAYQIEVEKSTETENGMGLPRVIGERLGSERHLKKQRYYV